MKVNPDDPRTTSDQIAAGIRRSIKSGELGGGDRLPSVRSLMSELGVSSQTTQAALSTLKSEGLIETVPGRGVFVRSGIDSEDIGEGHELEPSQAQAESIRDRLGEVLNKLDSLEGLVQDVEGRVRHLESSAGVPGDAAKR